MNLNLYPKKLLHATEFKNKKTPKAQNQENFSFFSKGNPLKVAVYNLQKQSYYQEIAYFHELSKKYDTQNSSAHTIPSNPNQNLPNLR